MKKIRVAIAGLGRVGSKVLQALISLNSENLVVVAIAEPREELEAVNLAKQKGIAYFKDARDMLRALDDAIDVLFDLTGNAVIRTELYEILSQSGNRKTVILPESVAHLVWILIESCNK